MTHLEQVPDPRDRGVGDKYTVPSSPPATVRPQRRARWPQVFDECREHPNEWRMVAWPFARSTARQLASDIRNGHMRLTAKRITGIRTDDRFETRVGQLHPDGANAEWFLWVRWVKADVQEGGGPSAVVSSPSSRSSAGSGRDHLHVVKSVSPDCEQEGYWQVNPDTDRVEQVATLRMVHDDAADFPWHDDEGQV